MPEEQVNAMMAHSSTTGPAIRPYNPEAVPLLRLLAELKSRPKAAQFSVEKPGFKLTLKGRADAASA
jgi:hypothetical protein